MKAIVVRQFGGPECMELVHDHPIPEPGPGQVLVRVHAAGVNPVDCYIRAGRFFILPELPYTPGRDGAGILEKINDSAPSGLNVGDRCWFGCGPPETGSYAQFALVSHTRVFPLAENASFAQGAALGVAYGTAMRALYDKAHLPKLLDEKKPMKVFVHGISGGVGLAACQLARTAGALVFGTAGTPDGIQRCMEMPNGPQKVWSHREPDYIQQILAEHPQGFDLILEMLANKNLSVDLAHLAALRATVVVIGSRGTLDGFDPRALMTRELTVKGVALQTASEEEISQMGVQISEMLKNGAIVPQIGRRMALSQTGEAHVAMLEPVPGQGNTFGKLVIELDAEN